MLKARLLTATALLVFFLAALFYLPAFYWAGLMAIVAALAAWEWGGLVALSSRRRLLFGALVLCACLGVMFCFPDSITLKANALEILQIPYDDFNHFLALIQFRVDLVTALYPGMALYFIAACFWCLIAPFWLRSQGIRHLICPDWLWSRLSPVGQAYAGKGGALLLGMLLILATWFAFAQLRAFSPLVLLMALGIAWVADTFAYFAGRTFGGRKLAPAISPGKTWAGVFGALAGVLLYGVGVVAYIRGHYHVSAVMRPDVFTVVIFLFLAAWGIVGDLFESLLKRQSGVKDSGRLLPGHGGVLDRIDSLMAILPIFALTFILWAAYAPLPRR
jgi:phosphatidate cytidylyltransferase